MKASRVCPAARLALCSRLSLLLGVEEREMRVFLLPCSPPPVSLLPIWSWRGTLFFFHCFFARGATLMSLSVCRALGMCLSGAPLRFCFRLSHGVKPETASKPERPTLSAVCRVMPAWFPCTCTTVVCCRLPVRVLCYPVASSVFFYS